MRLNLGSGNYPMDGWTNVDAYVPADIEADFRELDFSNVEAVRMTHVLEHISWRETVDVLSRIRSWMRPGARIFIEVPNIGPILAAGTKHPLWFKYVFGDQSHPGEAHLAGFTDESLAKALVEAGFTSIIVRGFRSEHKGREGMPCLAANAVAPPKGALECPNCEGAGTILNETYVPPQTFRCWKCRGTGVL